MTDDMTITRAALVASGGKGLLVSEDGEVEALSPAAAGRVLADHPCLLVAHAGFTARRLGAAVPGRRPGLLDVAELFAFVRPAAFATPTPAGLARAMGLPLPADAEEEALTLFTLAHCLFDRAAAWSDKAKGRAAPVAALMAGAGWGWGEALLETLGATEAGDAPTRDALAVWKHLPRFEDEAPRGAPGTVQLPPEAVRARLAEALGAGAEARPQQADYAARLAAAFAPRDLEGAPNVVLAEAGTGIGKTAGYLAPATLWAREADGAVWIATFTKNLQRQIDTELARFYPDPAERRRRAVVRKGRENYLCLLNFEEATRRASAGMADPVAMGLIARWALRTRDGDLVGGDFPAWLGDLTGGLTAELTDRRGECIHAACEHYRRCFIERTVRRARQADIVVANHALVMAQAAIDGLAGSPDDDGVGEVRTRHVFDEGHHLFEAADSAFCAVLSGLETADMRRWIRGTEGRRRARGIETRMGELAGGIEDDGARETALEHLKDAIRAAAALPGEGWATRIRDGQPSGPAEVFLARLAAHARARAEGAPGGQNPAFGIEAELRPVPESVVEAGIDLARACAGLRRPLIKLAEAFRQRMEDEVDDLDAATRVRLAAAARGLERRARVIIPAWEAMLKTLDHDTPEGLVDWVEIATIAPRVTDVALRRHWIDPTVPFVQAVVVPSHGVAITSATLRDGALDEVLGAGSAWSSAELRTGMRHLVHPVARAAFDSPFDYAARTRFIVVTDVRRDAAGEVAAAYQALFAAAGGGALGLFTAIRRLRAVHERIAGPLAAAGLSLYAQHVDAMDVGTLVDIFREEKDACLLGTDAVRDGVDVPGEALRLIVFDRVPWPRASILHKARRKAFGGHAWDDMLTRLKLRQAYGRLIRQADDRGVFVILDAMTPSRLLTGLPPGVEVVRTGIADAVRLTQQFLRQAPDA